MFSFCTVGDEKQGMHYGKDIYCIFALTATRLAGRKNTHEQKFSHSSYKWMWVMQQEFTEASSPPPQPLGAALYCSVLPPSHLPLSLIPIFIIPYLMHFYLWFCGHVWAVGSMYKHQFVVFRWCKLCARQSGRKGQRGVLNVWEQAGVCRLKVSTTHSWLLTTSIYCGYRIL